MRSSEGKWSEKEKEGTVMECLRNYKKELIILENIYSSCDIQVEVACPQAEWDLLSTYLIWYPLHSPDTAHNRIMYILFSTLSPYRTLIVPEVRDMGNYLSVPGLKLRSRTMVEVCLEVVFRLRLKQKTEKCTND